MYMLDSKSSFKIETSTFFMFEVNDVSWSENNCEVLSCMIG